MPNSVIAQNLRRLRVAKGRTQEWVAGEASVSIAAYRNYEAGRAIPKVNMLLAIAKALGATLNDLVTEARPLSAVRFRATKQLRSRDEVLNDVAMWLDDYLELEQLTGDTREWKLQGLVGRHDPEGAASTVRGLAGIGNEPIRDICGLLDSFGVKVLARRVCTDGFFGLCVGVADGGPAVVVNTWERIPVERWIFSAAHELGHLLLHPGSFRIEEQAESSQEENEANRFASCILMPALLFRSEWGDTWGLPFVDRVLKVKRIFRVSYKTVLYRLHEEGDHQVWQRFNFQHARRYGPLSGKRDPEPLSRDEFQPVENERPREPKRLEDVDFTEDRFSRLVRAALENDLITRSRAAEILHLSPEEMVERTEEWVA